MEKFDTYLTDLLHRHHRHTRVRLLNFQHPVEIFISSSKTECTTELGCSFSVQIARRYQCDFIRVGGGESRERSGMALARMFTTANQRNSNHCASAARCRE